jgi:uncharacterized protein (TIGR02594 family)
MIEPVWLTKARADIGQRETLGPNDSPWIRAMLKGLGGLWLLGQPWCGGAMAKWMEESGIERPRHWYRALAWAKWGTYLPRPVIGTVVVYDRGKGQGHVGIAVGRTQRGEILTLGGNQRDAVSIVPIDAKRLVSSRWPTSHLADWGLHLDSHLPLLASTEPVSRNEA